MMTFPLQPKTFAIQIKSRIEGRIIIASGTRYLTGYAVGIILHLVTSIIFGIVYVVIARIAGFDPLWAVAIAVYVFVLWLAMLVVALPVAGQGFMGNRIRSSVWLEQLALHAVLPSNRNQLS